MVEKTLSSGTLNLRFMQNARRPQQLPQVEPQQAHVKDDAEWEVSSEIREAWGPSAYRGEKAVTYETSYLPFLFSSLYDTPAADGASSVPPANALRPRGRRVFNKRGEEITQQASSSTLDAEPLENSDSVKQEEGEQTKKIRLHSISSTGKSALIARQAKKSSKDPSKDAKNVIFDMTGVGSDLRQSFSTQSTAFLRPSGVDDPVEPAKFSNSMKSTKEIQPSTGGMNPSKPNSKRSRTTGDSDRLKKKTKLAMIE